MTWTTKKPTKHKRLLFACKLFTWMERFLWIRCKDMRLRRFNMNRIQQILAQYVAWCWANDVPVKVMLPKSRQLGSSTFWQALFTGLAELKQGYRTEVVAHDEEGADQVISRTRTFARQIEEKGEWSKFDLVYDAKGLLEWRSESSISAKTIRSGDALGKGGTPSGVHFSESANFADKGNDAIAACVSLMNAVPDTPWTVIVHESTAKGKDPFFWTNCEKARKRDSGSTYQLIFLPWFLDPSYSMGWKEYRKRLIMSGKEDPGPHFEPTAEERTLRTQLQNAKVREHEELYRYRYDLKDEQLIWRRFTLIDKCEGKEDMLKRYYPSFYEECFTASVSCMFDAQTIDHYRNTTHPPQARGVMEHTHHGPAFVTRPDGPVYIWQSPQPRCDYVIGADPGGDKRHSDPCAAYVVNRHTLEVVAFVHGHFAWDEFADQLYALGMFYNSAYLVVENNTRPAICMRLHRRSYPALHYHKDQDRARPTGEGDTPGFNMNRDTRRKVLSRLSEECRTRYLVMPEEEFWREMENMVWVPKATGDNPDRDGVYRAVGSNHDDRIMAASMAVFFCPERDKSLEPHEVPIVESASYRMFMEFSKRNKDDSKDMLNL